MPFRHRYCLVLLLLSLSHWTCAQQTPYLPFYSKDTTRLYQLAVSQRALMKARLVVPKTGSSEYREHYRRVVQEASQQVYNSVRYSALLDPVVEPFVQQVFARILQANPQLPATTRLILSRHPEPNAHAAGGSTVILNLGLLPRLENESQLAFILCHELAHISSHHLETNLQDQLLALHSRELKREVRRIVNSEYNINSQIKALALGISLNSSYHSRRHERQADSLGYVLLARTAYQAPQAYRALQLLDTIDEPETAGPAGLTTYFACSAFPKVSEAVPTKPQSIFTVQAAEKTLLETTDTLKSHPDCAKRMQFLRRWAQHQVAEGRQPASSPEFARIRDICRLEIVQSWFDFDCYDHALFEALSLLPHQPDNSYLQAMVVLSLYGLRQHLQEHTYTEVVSNISPRHPAAFNSFLYALYDLQHEDFARLSACFRQALPTTLAATPNNEYVLAADYAEAVLASRPTVELRTRLQQQYAGGKFHRLLFPVPTVRARAR